jgi:hypothetical protein
MEKDKALSSPPKIVVISESLPIKINIEASRQSSARKRRRRTEVKEPQLDKYSDRAKPPGKKSVKNFIEPAKVSTRESNTNKINTVSRSSRDMYSIHSQKPD